MYYTLLAGLWQRYSGSGGDHKIDIDRKIAQDKDSSYDTVSRLVTNINEQTGYLEINSLQVRGSKASTSNGIFRTYIYMLKHQGATDWIDGTEFFQQKVNLLRCIITIYFLQNGKASLNHLIKKLYI